LQVFSTLKPMPCSTSRSLPAATHRPAAGSPSSAPSTPTNSTTNWLRLGLDVEKAFGVNHNGERLVPKGSSVEVVDVDADKDYGPRPWNDRAAEFDLLSDDEKKAVWEEIKGEEFIFCGSYRGAEYGSVIHVVPVEWFNKHGTMWENTADPRPLNIGHVLPADLKEHVPGTYVSRSRDWNALTFDLARKGMVENMFLQLHLNNQ
jgi:hypothetical protein